MTVTNTCPCCSGKHFNKCCGRFLEQGQVAKTAEQLMRSRYTAYSLGGHGDYLMATWLDAESKGLNSTLLSISENDWTQLDVIDKSQQGNDAIVEFKAHYLDDAHELHVLHERSSFKRIDGRWYYVAGDIK